MFTALFNLAIYTLVLWGVSRAGVELSSGAIMAALVAGSGAAAVANFILSKYFSFAGQAGSSRRGEREIAPSPGPTR